MSQHRFAVGQKVYWKSDTSDNEGPATVTEQSDLEFGFCHDPMYFIQPEGFPKAIPAYQKELSECPPSQVKVKK